MLVYCVESSDEFRAQVDMHLAYKGTDGRLSGNLNERCKLFGEHLRAKGIVPCVKLVGLRTITDLKNYVAYLLDR